MFASNAHSAPFPLPPRGGAGRLWGGEAFGVPQRGAAYQPGVEPRVGQSRNRCVLKERCITSLRGIRPPFAEEAPRRWSFRALREGVEVFASKARSSLTPLRSVFKWAPQYPGCAASGLRSLSRLREG